MLKYRLLALPNFALALAFSILLANTIGSIATLPEFSLRILIDTYLLDIIILIAAVVNLFIAYELITAKEKPNHKTTLVYIASTLYSIIWILLVFIGWFFASNVIFLVTSLLVILLTYLLVQRLSRKAAMFLASITALTALLAIISGFEEDYCWKKGAEVDYGAQMMIATKEDAEALKGDGVTEGSQISASFRTHMLCHQTFSFFDAVKEQYLLAK